MSEQLIAGRYRKDREIGVGGMGTVYLGTDTTTGDPVAIKELKAEVVKHDPEIVERFEREGEALRKLNHPSIVKVLATAEEDDRHYIMMEYVDGGSLRDKMDEEAQMDINTILNIGLDLSDALARAHRLNIIHRDIKPANVLIASDGTPRLTDFGVAHIGDNSRLTKTGVVVGTLSYLAPEAVNGEKIDTRADLWAFGVMLYEMLTGVLPFQSENTGGLLMKIMADPTPDILQYRAYDELGSWGLPGLIYWLLEKERDKRPSSARLVGAVLENLLSGKELPMNWFGDDTGRYDDDSSSSITALPPDTAIKAIREYTTSSFSISDINAELASADVSDAPPPYQASSPPASGSVEITTDTERPISRSDWTVNLKRVIDHPPRIFISYRRADSISVTGRLYDRLVQAFGDENVFKDVDNIPVGVNFVDVLDAEVASADVVLVIIGNDWLNTFDDKGSRRLDDPHDFVRIEVVSALSRRDLITIPVLVNGATMPSEQHLPDPLIALTYRNAAAVRNDPDFNRDVEWLIQQIQNSFEVKRKSPVLGGMVTLGIVGLLVAFIALFVLFDPMNVIAPDEPTQTPTVASTATSVALTIPTDLPTNLTVPPVAEGHYMVLVAEIEHIEGDTRDVQRFIIDDLRFNIEDAPLSAIEIRAYPEVVTSEREAAEVAAEANAHVIIWGNYDSERVEVNLQLGDPELFPDLVFPFEEAQSIANVRYHMENERRETLAYSIVGAFNVALPMSNDVWSLTLNLAIAERIDRPPAEVIGNSAAAYFHRYIASYDKDIDTAITHIDEAIRQKQIAFLYSARALGYQRAGNAEAARQDIATLDQLSPDDWLNAEMMRVNDYANFQNDFAAAETELNQVLEVIQDDWFYWGYRATMRYILNEDEGFAADVERSMSLNPQANFVYMLAISGALHQGDFVAVQQLTREVLRLFPDPDFIERIFIVTFNEEVADSLLPLLVSSFGNFTLERWSDVIDDTQAIIDGGVGVRADVYFLQGYAYCNLGDYAAAEAAYDAGLELEPDFLLLYFLRAEVRRNQGNLLGAGSDVLRVTNSDQSAQYQALLGLGDDMTCETFLDVEMADIMPANTGE